MKLKKLAVLLAAVCLCAAAVPVQAEEIPYLVEPEQTPILRDVQISTEGKCPAIIKLYETPPGYDPLLFSESGFEKDGIQYTPEEPILVRENYKTQEKMASQTVTMSHGSKEGNALFSPILDYSMDGFTGQLQLDRESIVTVPVGQKGYSYTVSDVREISGLARNDTYAIPKTATKNGISLKLADVRWTNLGTSYAATATYSGTGYGSKTTGYSSTACYLGEVCKEELESRTYKVVYVGTLPPAPVPEPPVWPWVLAASGVVLLLFGAALSWRLYLNTKVYVLSEGRCHLAKRLHLSRVWPTVNLTAPALQPARDFLIVPDRWLVKRLEGTQIRVRCADGKEALRYADFTESGLRIQLENDLPGWEEDEF